MEGDIGPVVRLYSGCDVMYRARHNRCYKQEVGALSEDHGREREHSKEEKDGKGYEQETSEASEVTNQQEEAPQGQEYSTRGALHNIVRWIRNRFG